MPTVRRNPHRSYLHRRDSTIEPRISRGRALTLAPFWDTGYLVVAMPHSHRALVTAALVAVLVPTRAYACGGPCTSPELWGVLPVDAKPLVVTNFGLLRPIDGGWQLVCEEAIGGILLEVRSNDAHAVVSTDVGLFVSGNESCGFAPGPTSERSPWFLDVAVAADSTPTTPHLLGLVSDPDTASINVEVSDGAAFEVLHDLGTETAYRHIEASKDLRSIVVAGYASQPRRWQVAWSGDGGESWQEFTPEVDAPSTSALLMGLDPADPTHVFFQLQGTEETPAELWSLRLATQTASQLLVLEAGQAITGIAFVGDELWVASKGANSGGLRRAHLSDVSEFEPVVEDVPPLSCLGVVGAQPFVCVDDYSADSRFLLGRVNTVSGSFEPELALSDLGNLRDCGTSCQPTHQWLQSVYGADTDAGSDTSGGEETSEETPPPPKNDGGCSIESAPRRAGDWSSVLLCVVGLWVMRRRLVAQHHDPVVGICNVNPRQFQRHTDGTTKPRLLPRR